MSIVLFGCGGHARSIVGTLLKNDKKAEILLVDCNAKMNEEIMGFKVEPIYNLEESDTCIVAIGDNDTRKKVYNRLYSKNYNKFISVISNTAYIGSSSYIGTGTFVAPCAYIGSCAYICNNTIINSGSIVEHETRIGNHTHIAPHATVCGRAEIGDNVFCGAGSTVIDKISICDNVVIGAGAVVIENITEPGIYIGVPARKLI